MLQPPKKNFGVLPTGELFTHSFVFIFLGVVPLIVLSAKFLSGASMEDTGTLRMVVAGIITGRYIWTIFTTPGGLRTIWEISRRRRYIHKSLNTYFKAKYGVKIANVDAVLTGDNLALKGKNAPQDAFLLGWEYVETVAAGESLDSPLEENLFIVQPEEGKAVEIPLSSGIDEDRATFTSHEHLPTAPTLGETEEGIKLMMAGIIQSLPAGTANLRCIAPASSEMGVESVMTVDVDYDARLSYSIKEMQGLVESILFNVRLAESAMVICIVKTASEKKYICGHIVKNTGYSDVPVDLLKEITDEDDFRDFIYVKNSKEMHP